MSQEQSVIIFLSGPTGPSTTNDEVKSAGLGETDIAEAEHQVSDSLQHIGLAKLAKKSTIPGLVPPPVTVENAPFKADKAEAIASLRNPSQSPPGESASIASERKSGQVAFGPTGANPEPQDPQPEGAGFETIEIPETDSNGSDEEPWGSLDESLFGEEHGETLTADESSGETAPGPSAIPPAGAAPEPAPGPPTELSSRPLAVPTPAAAVEEGTGSPANPSLPVVEVPLPATIEPAIGSQTDAPLTVGVNALASSISTETSSSLAPSTSNSAQSPPSLTQIQSTLVPASSSVVATAVVNANSPTHMADQSTSATATSFPLSSTSASTAKQPGVFSSRNVGWLSLPAEVREEVYKELLLVDMHHKQRNLTYDFLHNPVHQEQRALFCHHLHVDILRVNRQIFKEASDILYLRNTWVQINMNAELGQYIESRINNFRYNIGRSPIELCPVEFSGVAAMNIVVYNKGRKNLQQQTYIISSFAMPQICRAVAEIPPLELELDSAPAPEGAMWDQKGLLDCFVETRGLGALRYTKRVAMLAEYRGKDGLAQLGAIALPLNDPAVAMERASTYLNRGRRKVRAKHINEALTILREGADYNIWVAFNSYGMSSSVMADSGICTQFWRNWWDFIEERVSCYMQLGDMTLAGNILLSLFKTRGGGSTDKWAEGYHMLGLINEALGAENAAAYSFLRALYATPGHEATNKAIDRLRERVRDGTSIEHVIVRHNIDNVLEPFRHRTAGQTPLGEAEARSIVEKFVGQICDLDTSHKYTDDLDVSEALSSTILPCLISDKLTERAGNNWYLKLLECGLQRRPSIVRRLAGFNVADNLPHLGIKERMSSIIQ